jgi:hypothetical protein
MQNTPRIWKELGRAVAGCIPALWGSVVAAGVASRGRPPSAQLLRSSPGLARHRKAKPKWAAGVPAGAGCHGFDALCVRLTTLMGSSVAAELHQEQAERKCPRGHLGLGIAPGDAGALAPGLPGVGMTPSVTRSPQTSRFPLVFGSRSYKHHTTPQNTAPCAARSNRPTPFGRLGICNGASPVMRRVVASMPQATG